MAHDVYDDMFAIIVRPNKNMKHLNEEFVVKDLCKGKNQASAGQPCTTKDDDGLGTVAAGPTEPCLAVI